MLVIAQEGGSAKAVRQKDTGHGEEAHGEKEGARIREVTGGPHYGEGKNGRHGGDTRDDDEVPGV